MTPHEPPCAPLQVHEARTAESASRADTRLATIEAEYERLRASRHEHGDRLTRAEGAIEELRRDDGRHERAVTALEAAVGELRSVVAILSQTARGGRWVAMEIVRWLVPMAAMGALYYATQGG